MTTPQDPNQPGWGAPPPAPNQQGWGTPPPSAPQPGWGAPPPGAPQQGWGAPPPAPNQQGWGTPPPGAPQQGWGQPGWGGVPPQSRSNRHGCLIAFIVVLVLVVLGVGGCLYVAVPYVQMDLKIMQDIGTNRVSSVSFNSDNGHVTWVIHLEAGYEADAHDIGCNIVGPDLRSNSQFAHDDWEIVSSSGMVLADQDTPCP